MCGDQLLQRQVLGLDRRVRHDDEARHVVRDLHSGETLDLGAARVWVLDVAQDFHGWAGEGMSALDVLLESFAIARSHLGRRSPVAGPRQRVVTLPAMRTGRLDLRDFSRTSSLLAAGREAGRAMIAAELSTAPRPGASAAG